MEVEPAIDYVYANDNYFPDFCDNNEDDLAIMRDLDAIFAEELQFQEALTAAMITCQLMPNVEAASSPSVTIQEATPGLNMEPSLEGKEKGDSSQRFCEICQQWKEKDQMIQKVSCAHSFCYNCINKLVKEKIQGGRNMISCPGLGCGTGLRFSIDRRFNTKEVSKDLIVGSSELFFCPFNDCNDMWVDDRSVTSNTKLECPSCHRLFCMQCRVAWHSGADCEEFQRTREIQKEREDHMTGEPGGGCKFSGIPKIAEEDCQNLGSSKEMCKEINLENGGGKPATASTINNQSPVEESKQFSSGASTSNDQTPEMKSKQFSPGKMDTSNVNPSQDQAKLKVHEKKYVNVSGSNATKPLGLQSPNPEARAHDSADKISSVPSNSNSEIPEAVKQNDSHESDSDTEELSDETSKKSKLVEIFFHRLEKLTAEQVQDPNRQWHCPACQGLPDATKWFQGLQALISHAKTKTEKRVKLHRNLSQLLEEKFNKETSTTSACGKWKCLEDNKNDEGIVWPPMVFIRNTVTDRKDATDKWVGITNQDLRSMFSPYSDAIVKIQHSYNWWGHLGVSVLIFESSARGYLEAERLHRHLAEQGKGRDAWNHHPVYILSSGEKQLYGYLAEKDDVENFNESSGGKSKVKYEMRSYEEMVVNQIKQMSEENHQLILLQERVKGLEKCNGILETKLNRAVKETEILRSKSQQQHEQNIEEMNFLEQFLNEQIKILEGRDGNHGDSEKAQQEKKNCQLILLQEKVKDLEKCNGILETKLNRAVKETEILRSKSQQQHEQNIEEMNFLEQFLNEQIKILEGRDGNHGDSEKAQQEKENRQLILLQERVKDLEKCNGILETKLNRAVKETKILRSRFQQQHEQNIEEMKFQEQFYNEQIKIILEGRDGKDGDSEKAQGEEAHENYMVQLDQDLWLKRTEKQLEATLSGATWCTKLHAGSENWRITTIKP